MKVRLKRDDDNDEDLDVTDKAGRTIAPNHRWTQFQVRKSAANYAQMDWVLDELRDRVKLNTHDLCRARLVPPPAMGPGIGIAEEKRCICAATKRVAKGDASMTCNMRRETRGDSSG
jgi:hypothetical protein